MDLSDLKERKNSRTDF